jgi:hypothetical protein
VILKGEGWEGLIRRYHFAMAVVAARARGVKEKETVMMAFGSKRVVTITRANGGESTRRVFKVDGF